MKLKLQKFKDCYQSGVYRGNGGVSSMITSRTGSIFHCLGVFSIRNIWRALTW